MSAFTDSLQKQGDRWTKHEPASTDAIERFEKESGVSLPQDYRDFLLWSNGGTLRGPQERFELLRIELMSDYLDDEDLQRDLPSMIVFGITDGGGIYFFDPENRFHRKPWAIYWGRMGYLEPSASRFAGEDLLAVAKRIVEGVDFFSEPEIGS
jgi:hypothetical protein